MNNFAVGDTSAQLSRIRAQLVHRFAVQNIVMRAPHVFCPHAAWTTQQRRQSAYKAAKRFSVPPSVFA